jgi:hypothetical protein
VQAGAEREALLRVADRLCAELGYDGNEEVPDAPSPLGAGAAGGQLGPLSPEDESLVAKLRQGLARIAAAVSGAVPGDGPQRSVGGALDGAELVMRGAMASGNAEQLPSLMPSFVFLVALPIVKQDRALELSHRTSELLEGELRT